MENVTDGSNDGEVEGESEGFLDGPFDSVIVGIKLGLFEGIGLGTDGAKTSPPVSCAGVVPPKPSSPPGTPVLKECLRLRLRRLVPAPPFCSAAESPTFVTTALAVVPVVVVALVLDFATFNGDSPLLNLLFLSERILASWSFSCRRLRLRRTIIT